MKFSNIKIVGTYRFFGMEKHTFCFFYYSLRVLSIDIGVSRLAIGFHKVCFVEIPTVPRHHPQFCVAYSAPSGSILSNSNSESLVKPTSCPISAITNQILSLIG